jgi:hypothetical protein
MSDIEITLEGVQGCLGDGFTCRAYSGGNIQVSFAQLSGMTGEDICQGLLDAAKALKAGGYPASVRTSWKNRDGNWTSFPHVWVNRPRPAEVAQQETSARMDKIEETLGVLAAFIQKGQPEATSASAPDPENPL